MLGLPLKATFAFSLADETLRARLPRGGVIPHLQISNRPAKGGQKMMKIVLVISSIAIAFTGIIIAVVLDVLPWQTSVAIRTHQTLLVGLVGALAALATATTIYIAAIIPITQNKINELENRKRQRIAGAAILFVASEKIYQEVFGWRDDIQGEFREVVLPGPFLDYDILQYQDTKITLKIFDVVYRLEKLAEKNRMSVPTLKMETDQIAEKYEDFLKPYAFLTNELNTLREMLYAILQDGSENIQTLKEYQKLRSQMETKIFEDYMNEMNRQSIIKGH
jgi:hypothetical protein